MKKISVLLFLLCSCATQTFIPVATPGSSVPNTDFQYDLKGDVNGVAYNGVRVFPQAKSYVINIKSDVDVDLLTVTSCHRDFSAQAAVKQDWWAAKRGYTYTYQPSPGIEDTGSCLLRIGAYNSKGEPAAWALLDFEGKDSTLPAIQKCNGYVFKDNGVSICQSRAGLYQQISFDVPTIISDKVPAQCRPTLEADGLTWSYVMPQTECVIAFMEAKPPHRKHRHSFIGFKTIQIRGQ